MEVLANIIAGLLLIIGVGIGVGNAVSRMTTKPESILEYCERTHHQWRIDECVYVQTRWRTDLPTLSE